MNFGTFYFDSYDTLSYIFQNLYLSKKKGHFSDLRRRRLILSGFKSELQSDLKIYFPRRSVWTWKRVWESCFVDKSGKAGLPLTMIVPDWLRLITNLSTNALFTMKPISMLQIFSSTVLIRNGTNFKGFDKQACKNFLFFFEKLSHRNQLSCRVVNCMQRFRKHVITQFNSRASSCGTTKSIHLHFIESSFMKQISKVIFCPKI